MNETNVKTVKKIKKVVVTEDTRYQTFGIDTEFKSDKQFPKSENKEYPKIVNLDCADSKSNDVVVKKVKKVVKSVEPTYYVHTCGYDYVIDTIDADVAFSGSESECKKWLDEHSDSYPLYKPDNCSCDNSECTDCDWIIEYYGGGYKNHNWQYFWNRNKPQTRLQTFSTPRKPIDLG